MFKFLKRKKDKPEDKKVSEQTKEEATQATTIDPEDENIVADDTQTNEIQSSSIDQTAQIEEPPSAPQEPADIATTEPTEPPPEKKKSLFKRLTSSLTKTRKNLASGLSNLFLGRKTIDDDLLDDIETQLISADIGINASEALIEDLTDGISRKEIKDPQAVLARLKQGLLDIIKPCEQHLDTNTPNLPHVILMVGVNGSGKTTTIGKLAKKLQTEGKSVMLAAGDTFRAAAIEQLQVWGMRNDVPVIAQHTGADSASVAFDALSSAVAKGVDVLIIDTAGRLHTSENLMEELKKVKRVLSKKHANAPHEVMLVVDAGIGQNALLQAVKFNEAVDLTGITITKLDGTAKGGIIFAIAKELHLPIRYIGCGEQIDDLREFNAEEFIDALFISDEQETETT